MIPERELTAWERREIKRLVKSLCANYDSEYGCLPLDCQCVMLHKWWTGGGCKKTTCLNTPRWKIGLCRPLTVSTISRGG